MTDQEIVTMMESKSGSMSIVRDYHKWDTIKGERKGEIIKGVVEVKKAEIAVEIKSRLGYVGNNSTLGHLDDEEAKIYARMIILIVYGMLYKEGDATDRSGMLLWFRCWHPNDKAQLLAAVIDMLNNDYIYDLVLYHNVDE